jgi:hypothetical protein
MIIIDLKFEDLKRSLMTGGYAYETTAEPGSAHYIWMNKMFVPGVVTGNDKLDIPVDTNVPNLFFLLEAADKLKMEPTVYRVKSAAFTGLGVAFHNCPRGE